MTHSAVDTRAAIAPTRGQWIYAMLVVAVPRPRTPISPRRRPRQERAASTVEAILIAAAEVFAKHGFARASVNVIAERAGVSIGSMYQYFPSKHALLVPLIERHSRQAIDTLEAVLIEARTAPVRDVVHRVVEAMIEAHGGAFRSMLAREKDGLGTLDDIDRAVDARAGFMIKAALQLRAMELSIPDPELAAFLLVRAVDGLIHAALAERPDVVGPKLVDEISAFVLGYLTFERHPGRPRRPTRRMRRATRL